jgi:acyl-CoA reductase-like NAD-dependent aldehyde dehydrogenase
VEAQIADAVSKGARIEFGGSRIQTNGSGIYFEPTLITNVTHDMKIMHEETFGPVACVMEVDNVDEAIFLSNDSAYGLNASVWTRDIKSGIDIASRIEAGNVCVNDAILNAGVQSLPFGGVKQSGVGSRHGGERGLHVFCYTQALMIEGRNKSRESTWFPYIPKTARQMERVMTFLYGRNL